MGIRADDLFNLGLVSTASAQLKRNLQAARDKTMPSFSGQLSQLSVARPNSPVTNGRIDEIHLRLAGENCVYTGGWWGERSFQSVYVEYVEGSSSEDPVVHISGEADSGSFDFVCRISDINPSNASYAEMAALYGHMVHTGKYRGTGGAVTPYGYEYFGSRNMLEKQDFLAGLTEMSMSDQCGPRNRMDAKYLLNLYRSCSR